MDDRARSYAHSRASFRALRAAGFLVTAIGLALFYVGSPLVIDLDDDGLELTSTQVRFDLLNAGHPVRSTWIQPDEGFLALDLDGDGRIESGAELFGDRSDCGGQRCYDGVDALARWDSPASGGNGDGVIDASDAIFSRLLVWVDQDLDGVSNASELAPLSRHGVLAIHLEHGKR